MAQPQSQNAKVLVDSRMRDIRRRVEVIQKKLADLQEMGVPCAFCYSSVRNTGSIFTLGDMRITDVIEQHRNEILCNLMEGGSQAEVDLVSNSQEIHLILPVLPAPLDKLRRTTLQSMIVGILKDLGIRWSDPKPIWWPENIPFVPPRSAPENFAGNWIHALKRILKSVYSYFSYDTNSYIASKLGYKSKNGLVNWDQMELRRGHLHGGEQQDDDTEEENDTDLTDESDDDDDDDEPNQSPRENAVESDRKSPERDLCIAPTLGRDTSSTSKPPAKLVSSFTVENILMGRQYSSSSSSSSSSTGNTSAASASMHTPTSSLRPMAAATTSHAMPFCTSSTSSSIVGVNWVSHPPVKYTKFTMLSPTAMSDEASKKRKSSFDHPAVLNPKSFKAVTDGQEASLPKRKDTQIASLKSSSQVTCAQPVSSNLVHESVAAAASSSSAVQVYPIASLKEFPASSISLTTNPTRLCTLPVVTALPALTSLDRKSAMTCNPDRKSAIGLDWKSAISSERKSAITSVDRNSATSNEVHPPQQYVFIVPSNSVVFTSPSQYSAADNSDPSGRTIKTVVMGCGSGNTTASNVKTALYQNSLSITSSRTTTVESSVEKPIASTNVLSESNSDNFRLIAPKNKTPLGPPRQDRTSKSKVLKRASQKPHKLRFHMTTVVTKQKREPVRGSMTVESPSAVVNDVTESRNTPPSSKQEETLDRTVAIESAITCSPNMYSAETISSSKIRSNEKHVVKFCEENKLKKVEEMKLDSLTRKRVNLSSSGRRKGEKDTVFSSIKHIAEPRAKGRATRNYTRRKRELTFHLYEDPETAFRVKKACKE